MARVTHLKDESGECITGCFGCKLEGFTVAPSAMGTRFPESARAALKDPLLVKDREAYRRLRRNGEQPKHVGGSAQLEATASESCEITTGQIIPDTKDRKQFAQAFAEMPSEPQVRTSPDQAPIHA